jgi:hypothetical protein
MAGEELQSDNGGLMGRTAKKLQEQWTAYVLRPAVSRSVQEKHKNSGLHTCFVPPSLGLSKRNTRTVDCIYVRCPAVSRSVQGQHRKAHTVLVVFKHASLRMKQQEDDACDQTHGNRSC